MCKFTDCRSLIFHLDYFRWCRFMCVTHVGKENQCCRRGRYMSHMIILPMQSIHTCVW